MGKRLPTALIIPHRRATNKMEFHEVEKLAVQHLDALETERLAQQAVADYEQAIEHTKARIVGQAYQADEIDKRNKDTRSAGEARVLAESERYQDLLDKKAIAEEAADKATVDRRYFDTLISLLKAWLYSQARIG